MMGRYRSGYHSYSPIQTSGWRHAISRRALFVNKSRVKIANCVFLAIGRKQKIGRMQAEVRGRRAMNDPTTTVGVSKTIYGLQRFFFFLFSKIKLKGHVTSKALITDAQLISIPMRLPPVVHAYSWPVFCLSTSIIRFLLQLSSRVIMLTGKTVV
ncbi:hypothetical protein AVEN_207792-1 [Araneus ventricosus]|uniref:Uncharacterized protein n=1 Tax=Araneus ventricosus TaxID=182803 RepID=A0A4Y2BZ62_ARAVE|nr:hypothetical protein AVEN_207792-1 [Araneus ventricosus]